ncbi:MAG: ferrous iron transport protein B [Bacteriovoracaceae bacterium]|nr:ferrous iron transport protein B [Bacteriovoracaceae bacterium]
MNEVLESLSESIGESHLVQLPLIGLPNAGKSTIFNLLTGGFRKVSNYSGITVEAARGELLTNNQENVTQYELIDLPGIYNLTPTSYDEGVTVSTLLELGPKYSFEKAIILLDWHRITPSLGMALGVLKRIGKKAIIIINKDDDQEVTLEDRSRLQRALGVPVLTISALNTDLKTLDHFIRLEHPVVEENSIAPLPITPLSASYLPSSLNGHKSLNIIPGSRGEEAVANEIDSNLKEARRILGGLQTSNHQRSILSDKIDKIVLHPLLGGIIFFAIFYLIFNAIYSWAGPIMELTEQVVLMTGQWVGDFLPNGLFKSLIVDALFGGVGGVLIFLPQIMILFFLLSLLEQSGYISRAALISDKVMSYFGLGGKAFLPYMSGYACAIPGIMAARTIPNQKERLATIMTLPLITCSARLPVYILIIGTFVPSYTVFKVFNTQALSFFFLYFLGSFAALIIAKILRLSAFKGDSSSFLIDLPQYEMPSFKAAFRQSWQKGRSFLRKAGTIILALSVLIWLLSTFPRLSEEKVQGHTPQETAALQLEHSILGRMGHTIEPVIRPLGMNWKIGVGLLVSFGARELFVSAMGTLYALGEVDEESEGLRAKLMAEIDPITKKPVFDLATAWSILFFFVFSLQCTSTLAILKKETGGWRIPIITFTYMLILAYSSSFLIYHALS